jgi:hypothetical protein
MDRKEDLPKSEKPEKSKNEGGEDPTALMSEGLREKGVEDENRGPRRPAST